MLKIKDLLKNINKLVISNKQEAKIYLNKNFSEYLNNKLIEVSSDFSAIDIRAINLNINVAIETVCEEICYALSKINTQELDEYSFDKIVQIEFYNYLKSHIAISQIQKNNQSALSTLQDMFNSTIELAFHKAIRKNSMHELLSVNYIEKLPEINNDVWYSIFDIIMTKGERPLGELPAKYIYVTAVNTTNEYRNKRLEIRTKSGIFSTFPRHLQILKDTPEQLPNDIENPENLFDSKVTSQAFFSSLSERQQMIIDLMMKKVKKEKIADILDINVKTLYNEKKRIESKFAEAQQTK